MNNMKKLIVVLAGLLVLAGCAKEQPKNEKAVTVIGKKEEKAKEEKKGIDFTFKSGSVEVKIGDDAKVVQDLGTPKKTFEAPSCVFSGKDVVSEFEGFEVNTATLKGKDIVVGIFFTTDKISTNEGLKIGDSKEKVEQLYGPLNEEGTYVQDKTKLVVVILDGKVTSIAYLGIFE